MKAKKKVRKTSRYQALTDIIQKFLTMHGEECRGWKALYDKAGIERDMWRTTAEDSIRRSSLLVGRLQQGLAEAPRDLQGNVFGLAKVVQDALREYEEGGGTNGRKPDQFGMAASAIHRCPS